MSCKIICAYCIFGILAVFSMAKPQYDQTDLVQPVFETSGTSNFDPTVYGGGDYAEGSKTRRMRQPNTSKMIPMVVRDEFGKLELVFVETNSTEIRKPPPKTKKPSTTTDSPRGTIFFPDEVFPEPPCANGGTFCTEVENYPTKEVESVLRTDIRKYEGLFGDDLVAMNISERFDPGEEEVLCKSEEKLIYPKLAKSNNDTWLYIINHNEYRQGIRIEMCATGTSGNACALTDSFPNSYTTECRQKYIYRHLVALNERRETIKELFKFPSCCQCAIKHKRFY